MDVSEPTLVYQFLRACVWTLYHTVFPMRVHGIEKVPRDGPLVLCVNHQSFLDIPMVAAAVPRHVAFVARDSLADNAFLGWIMRQCGAVLIKRGQADRAALREMLVHLEAGDCIAVFPEGTRTRDGRVAAFRGGALVAAKRAGAPVVPVGIQGNWKAWPRHRRLPRPCRTRIAFGEPLDPAGKNALDELHAAVVDLAES